MKKRWICLCAALTLAAGVCAADPIRSGAEPSRLVRFDTFDKDHTCSMKVYPEDPNKKEESRFGEDLVLAEVLVDVYRIADAVKVPGYDSYKYEFTGAYAGLSLEMWNASAEEPELEEPTASSWKELAQDAAEIALDKDEPAVRGVSIVEEGGGLIAEEDMKPGLYLLIARGADLDTIPDYKVTMEGKDEKVNGNIATIADSDQYTYIFAPELISLPMREAQVEPDGEYMTSDNDAWVYDLEVYLKPTRVQRYGPLRIEKTLSLYESESTAAEPVTFVFRAKWTSGDAENETTESRVGSITFDSAEKKEIVLERIPAGIDVTVTEEYSGAGYDPVGDITYTRTIRADRIRNGRAVLGDDHSVRMIIPGDIIERDTEEHPMTSVAFENQYNRRQTKGYGIRNHFDYDGENWFWSSDQGQDSTVIGGGFDTIPEQPEEPEEEDLNVTPEQPEDAGNE